MLKKRRRDAILAAYESLPGITKFAIGIFAYIITFYLSLSFIDICSVLLMVAMVFAISVLLAGIWNRKKINIFRGLWMSGFVTSIYYGSGRIIDYHTSIGKIKGENIAHRVEYYKRQHGTYPENIDSLSGNDGLFKMGLEKRKIIYRLRNNESSFCLTFYIQVMLTADYCSDTKEWVIDD
jgi:hypothetical protein